MPDAKDKPDPPRRKMPPAFGSLPERDEGLATGLGVAQPTEVDQPDPEPAKPAERAGRN